MTNENKPRFLGIYAYGRQRVVNISPHGTMDDDGEIQVVDEASMGSGTFATPGWRGFEDLVDTGETFVPPNLTPGVAGGVTIEAVRGALVALGIEADVVPVAQAIDRARVQVSA